MTPKLESTSTASGWATAATGFTASAVAGDGKLYFTSEGGDVYVVRAGEKFELLATNAMNEVCMATPAISDGSLFVRTQNHVYAIGAPETLASTRKPVARGDEAGNYGKGPIGRRSSRWRPFQHLLD